VSQPPFEVRPVTTGRSGRTAAVAAGAVAIALITVVIAGRLGSHAPARPADVAPTIPAAASEAPPARSLASNAVPLPSRLVPFRVPDGAGGPVTYVSPNLGFSVPLLLEAPPSGYWDEGGPPVDAGGVLTFSVPADSGAVGNGAVRVAVGSRRDPAPIRIPADIGPVTPLWEPTLVALVQEYALLLTGDLGTQAPIMLDGERALLFEHPGGAAAVVLAVHHDRIYVLASLTASPTRGSSRRAFTEFVAAFRFVEATVTP
jgi:hypothetical protein